SPMTTISFNNVSLSYGDLRTLRDLTFDIAHGESVALIGPSGCGKSTTLHLVAGLLQPARGSVLVDGEPVASPRRATAFIQQDLGLFPWKTVIQNAALGLTVRKVPKAEARTRAANALAKVGLTGFERAYPKELSGGMRQRLALARALAMDADLLLMDEPLSAIDALLRESLQDTLLELWRERGHTQMLVTHSIEEAVYLGQRIFVFSARPATLVAIIDNAALGTRTSSEFLATCQQVRAALATQNEAQEGGAHE
ncbi:MAG: ABC transporter ATP-binding protein, partial [Eggerthellaceae bacterium]|nr:ABC transporter ATP-binding protein [Eggerthellaceae bacterium]